MYLTMLKSLQMSNKSLHIKELESESIYVIREVASQFEKSVLLFSGGKDSIVMAHLSYKAFYPSPIPFPFLHIDTGHNFEETIIYRDKLITQFDVKLCIGSVQDFIDSGCLKEETGYDASRNKLQTTVLLAMIEKNRFDAALGGARRDEEKVRAKERFFSHRDEFGQWDPKNQRPELWNIFNGKKQLSEHFRVFPLSNWTEMDIWQYILEENIKLPSLYYTHEREVFKRDGVWFAYYPFVKLRSNERPVIKRVRCRTIGDVTCTGLTLSEAHTTEEIISEIAVSRITERGGRFDDKRSETAMEDRKKAGYF